MKIETNNINPADISRLVASDVHAIHVRNFVQPDVAVKLSENIMGRGYDKYENAPSIGRIGMAFYEAEGRPDRLTQYFDQAGRHVEELRARCFPYQSPIDILRCRLDEIWPAGAMLESLYGKKMYVGLSRILEPEVTFLAHHDILSKDAPDSFRTHRLDAQIACNVYLNMPDGGGDLHIWTHEIPPEEFDSMRGDSYGIDPKILGEPHLTIQPEQGDLVLFNSRLMHAVAPGKNRPRLSLSCFVGYRGTASPLTFWS